MGRPVPDRHQVLAQQVGDPVRLLQIPGGYTPRLHHQSHRSYASSRKLTKAKGAFPNENSLLKLLYVGIQNASKKWAMPIHNWNFTLSLLVIYFEGRLDNVLEI